MVLSILSIGFPNMVIVLSYAKFRNNSMAKSHSMPSAGIKEGMTSLALRPSFAKTLDM